MQTINLLDGNQKKIGPGDFNHIQSLGQGAFGEVYLVEKDEKFYAMKEMFKPLYFSINVESWQKEVSNLFLMNDNF